MSISTESRVRLIERQKAQLVDGEYLDGVIDVQGDEPAASDAEINQKYERGEVRIVTETGRYPLDSISALLAGDNYKLDPEYQRRHRWSIEQKSRLIESFIMNVPVPPIFIYEWDYNKYEVMDGLQRMTAVREFYDNVFALSGLEYWRELEGRKYSELPGRIKAGVDRRYISSIVLLKETSHGEDDPERLKRFVFGRINTGGVQLSAQELRNALYDGPMNALCKELSTNRHLRAMWGIPQNVEDLIEGGVETTEDEVPENVPESYRRMFDVELVLRFFANRQRLIHYRDNLKGYLDAYLVLANGFEQDALKNLARIFESTCALAFEIFGEDAFKKIRKDRRSNVPTTSIYDSLMNILSRMLDESDALVAKKDEIKAGLPDFYSENSDIFNLRGQGRSQVIDREVLLEQYLLGFLEN